jgi:hypothetical protein
MAKYVFLEAELTGAVHETHTTPHECDIYSRILELSVEAKPGPHEL